MDFGLGPAQAVLLGAITGIGGGMLRDVLLRAIPTALRQELYAIPALLGAGILVLARETGSASALFPVLGLIVRLVSLKYRVNVPVAPSVRHEGGSDD